MFGTEDGGTVITSKKYGVTIGAESTIQLTFTNAYTPYGSLKVTKAFGGLTEGQISTLLGQISFTAERQKDGSSDEWETVKTFTLSASDVKKDSDGKYYIEFTQLPLGTYRVTETISGEVTNYTRTSYVQVTDGTKSTGSAEKTLTSDSVQVTRGGIEAKTITLGNGSTETLGAAKQADFENAYKQDTGSIKITKTFSGDWEKLPEDFWDTQMCIGIGYNGNDFLKFTKQETEHISMIRIRQHGRFR